MAIIAPSALITLSVGEIIKSISEQVFEEIPEEVGADEMRKIEISLARLSNNYAYVVELLSYSRNYVRQLKRSGNKEKYEDMMDIRDALENIASAVKLQYQSVSRILTVKQQTMSYNDLHEYRKGSTYD